MTIAATRKVKNKSVVWRREGVLLAATRKRDVERRVFKDVAVGVHQTFSSKENS
jgi:uncharacterized protein YcgI (DUF1989 family)